MKYILVSACLLGIRCKYDGGHNLAPKVASLMEDPEICLIPVCPEQLGGLPTPRDPSECRGDKVLQCTGTDVTNAFEKGAEEALRIAEFYGCKTAILKERSPSCGFGQIYDGNFSRTLTNGMGKTAAMLAGKGFEIFTENTTDLLYSVLYPSKQKII